jgi:hypothetical protein
MSKQRPGSPLNGLSRRAVCLKIALGLGTATVGILAAGTPGIARPASPDLPIPPEIRILKVLPDGNMLAAVRFLPEMVVLYRFNPDGAADAAFSPPVFNGFITNVFPQNDGKLLVHGTFSTLNGLSRAKVAVLNPDGTPNPPLQPTSATVSGLARS